MKYLILVAIAGALLFAIFNFSLFIRVVAVLGGTALLFVIGRIMLAAAGIYVTGAGLVVLILAVLALAALFVTKHPMSGIVLGLFTVAFVFNPEGLFLTFMGTKAVHEEFKTKVLHEQTATPQPIEQTALTSPGEASLTPEPTGTRLCRVRADVDFLNVRSGPGVAFPLRFKLPRNTGGIERTGKREYNGSTPWEEIKFNGQTGWANPQYLIGE